MVMDGYMQLFISYDGSRNMSLALTAPICLGLSEFFSLHRLQTLSEADILSLLLLETK